MYPFLKLASWRWGPDLREEYEMVKLVLHLAVVPRLAEAWSCLLCTYSVYPCISPRYLIRKEPTDSGAVDWF